MKLKQKPEDFIVEEIPLAEIAQSSKQRNESHKYNIYTVTKNSIDLFSLLKNIARDNRIDYKQVGYAGIKDKYGITSQYISSPINKPISTETKQDKKRISQHEASNNNYTIEFVGHSDKPIKRGDLNGNTFKITIRDIPEHKKEQILKNMENLSMGIPNYFDSQRMGSFTDKGFLGKMLVQKKYELFVKTFLTNTTRHMNKNERHKRKYLLSVWDDPEKRFKCNPYLFAEKTWQERVLVIDAQEKEMAIAAYQSYLWNEAVKDLIIQTKVSVFSVTYAVGKLLFPNNPITLPETLEGVHPKIDLHKKENQIYTHILEKENVTPKDFDLQEVDKFFSKMQRKTFVTASNLSHTEFEPDELNKDKFKLQISFNLAKGSYATIVLKRILGE